MVHGTEVCRGMDGKMGSLANYCMLSGPENQRGGAPEVIMHMLHVWEMR